MNWNLEGLYVNAAYLDVPVIGKVERSRVAFGGNVKHTIVLNPPIKLSFRGDELVNRLIINHEDITRVRSNPDE